MVRRGQLKMARNLVKSSQNQGISIDKSASRQFSSVLIIFLVFLSVFVGHFLPAEGIFNCLTPNMFKMSKGGGFMPYEGAERSSWYPSQGPQIYSPSIASPASYMFGAYPQQPMRRLLPFQPKLRGGLFASKGWMGGGGWKMGSGFYRPGYGYNYPNGYGASQPGYPMGDINVAPFSIPSQYGSSYMGGGTGMGWPITPSSYSSAGPHIQQSTMNIYDSYSSTPIPAPVSFKPSSTLTTPTVDPYSKKGASKFTTTKNLLVADGGYNFYDAHLVKRNFLNLTNSYATNFGYSYPDWYSSVVDSPVRVAQQLLKMNLRSQRLQHESAPISASLQNPLSMLDEPRFVGFGRVDTFDGGEARLSCSFNEAIDLTNRPIWVKFLGPLSNLTSADPLDSPIIPTFNCADSRCRAQEIDSTKDRRLRIENGPATSTLIILDPKIIDYGIYRCSALTKSTGNTITSPQTIYQIVRFGDIK